MPCGILHLCGLVGVQDYEASTPEVPALPELTSYNGKHHPHFTPRRDEPGQAASQKIQDAPINGIATFDSNQVPRALESPRWTVRVLAKHMIVWLQKHFTLNSLVRGTDIAELTLHRVVHFPAEAEDLGEMLNQCLR
jgi:hypothetical protein